MKFLDGIFDNKPIMPLNIYYNRGSYNLNRPDDVIDIVYKDMDTGRKYVQTIVNPDIEIWICKKEFRDYNYIRNFFEMPKCYSVIVKYKTRFLELAKIMGTTQENVRMSPFIFGADVNIEHFYMMNFLKEYPNDRIKKLSMGYLDIELDIVSLNRFPEPGEVPINAVTYIDAERMQSYTLLLKKDDVPKVPEGNPKYHFYEKIRASFYDQIRDFENNLDSFIDTLHKKFDASYGELNYNILMFDKEIDLINALFQIINASDNDFIFIWNAPFDMKNLIERPKHLGFDPNSIIVNKAFGDRRVVYYKEDTNVNVHKRKHTSITYTMPTFVDQMVLYAGVRAGKGTLASNKLNVVAQKELKDTKLDYTDIGNMRYLPYLDYITFVMYNIKDVLLQLGIDRKTRDSDTLYTSIYTDAVLSNEIFTSTTVIVNSLRMFVSSWKCGYVMGYNANKFIAPIVQQYERNPTKTQSVDDDDDESDYVENPDEEEEVVEEGADPEESDAKKKKKKKFQGAFVMNPKHMSQTGYKILGSLSQFIHMYVVDEDIGAEYPTAIIIMNSSNETMVGKFFLENPDDIDVPIYNSFTFIDNEREEYKLDKSNFVMEIYSQGDVLNFGKIVLNLPDTTYILDDIESQLEYLRK